MKAIKILLFLIGFCPLANWVYAQSDAEDSLIHVLQNADEDTSLITALLHLVNVSFATDPNKALAYNDRIIKITELALSDTVSLNSGEMKLLREQRAAAFSNYGVYYYSQGKVKEAMPYLEKSLKLKRANGDIKGIASSCNNLGFIYSKQGDLEMALQYYLESLELYEELGDTNQMGGLMNNLGQLYEQKGEIPKTFSYYNKALEIHKSGGNQQGVAMMYNNIGFLHYNQGAIALALEHYQKAVMVQEKASDYIGLGYSYNNLAGVYEKQQDYTRATVYYRMSLEKFSAIENATGIAMAFMNIGGVFSDIQQLDSAEIYYEKALKVNRSADYSRGVARSLRNLGIVYYEQKQFKRADDTLRHSLKILQEIDDQPGITVTETYLAKLNLAIGNLTEAISYGESSLALSRHLGYPDNIKESAKVLSEIHKKKANWQESLEMYELYIVMRDSIKNEETQKATIRQQTRYEFEKAQLIKEQKEKEAARILAEETSRRDNLQYSIVLICLLAIGVTIAMLGRLSLPPKVAEGLIFFAFLIFFEFLLVLADPYIDNWSAGAPGIKLLFNAGIAALIFPLHALFEAQLKARLANSA